MSAAMDLRTDSIDPMPDFEIAPSLHRDCDRPLDPSLGFRDSEVVEGMLGLPPVPCDPTRQMRATSVANLMVASQVSGEKWVFYSRDRNHYSSTVVRRYAPPWYTHRNVLNAVASLEAAGIIAHDRTAPSPFAKFRSRLRATTDFALRLRQLGAGHLKRTPRELLILLNDRKSRVDYDETRHIARMRNDVRAHNAFLANHVIGLEHADSQLSPQGWIIVEDWAINPAIHCYFRVFNGDFEHGGRWYGHWVQAIPRRYRPALTIGGAATVELDFRTCHPRLLCALAGLALPFADPQFDFYSEAGADRASVKLAVNVMLNAPTSRVARLALASELRDRSDIDPSAHARELMDAIAGQWPQLAHFWSSGIGLRFQNIDAEICARVQRALRRAGIPVLSIHDSFIVRSRNQSVLADAMEEEMVRACAYLSRFSL